MEGYYLLKSPRVYSLPLGPSFLITLKPILVPLARAQDWLPDPRSQQKVRIPHQ